VSGSGVNIPLTADNLHFGPAYPGITFNGSGPNPSRQTSSHPHQVVEYGNEFLIPDLVRWTCCILDMKLFLTVHNDRDQTRFGGSPNLARVHFKTAGTSSSLLGAALVIL
jgi:hypothetical protein